MSIRRVRIYEGKELISNIIGFSSAASNAADNPRFNNFMIERGYQWSEADEAPDKSVSTRHVEVRPPLSEEHIRQLGILCAGGYEDERYIVGIISPGQDGVSVLDNRKAPPDHPLDLGEIVAEN